MFALARSVGFRSLRPAVRPSDSARALATLGALAVTAACTPDHPLSPVTATPAAIAPTPARETSSQSLPAPIPVSYTTFGGDLLSRYAWKGQHIAFLTERDDLDPQVMARLLSVFDGVYRYYAGATGGTPIPFNTIDGLLTVADVPDTCGAGCGYLGFTGIELQSYWWQRLYDGVAQRDEFDQVLFYEFGRNFWLWELDQRLAYKQPDDAGSVITGFAVFMRFASIDAVGVKAGPFNDTPWTVFRREVVRMSDRYELNRSLTLANTLLIGQAPANPLGLGSTDLFASFIMELQRTYGPTTYVPRLWQAVRSRPVANTTQDAVDNFVIAASIAANRNLRAHFVNRLRWTLSASAEAELGTLFPTT